MSPFRCRVWDLHNRLDDHLTEESCRDEIRSFREHGQLIPALGRRVNVNAEDQDIEIICGVRRLFVARHLNKPLLVEIRELSDLDAFVAMDLENRQRQDVSPYERGVGYAKWLRLGYFESQDKLASTLKVSPAHVSRLLKIARLPSAIVGAFDSATDICEGWGVKMAEALQNPSGAQRILKAARQVASKTPRPAPREVYDTLISSTVRGRRPKAMTLDTVVKGDDGIPLFRIKRHTNSIALVLPIDKVSAKSLSSIQQAVLQIMQGHADESAHIHAEEPSSGDVTTEDSMTRKFSA